MARTRGVEAGARMRRRIAGVAGVVASLAIAVHAAGQQAADAHATVARAADLMGGERVLRGVQRVSFDMMTQWQRTGFRRVPYTDRPSFENHYDVRDYAIPAWRNTRDFGARKIINVVRDSVALTDFGEGPRPLSVAYVDERNELFTYTPDRLVLALLDAPDLRAPGDTLIGGEQHRRISATLNGRYPSTVYFHSGTGLPTLLRFRAAHPADYGLVPWGEMDVAVWYSGWAPMGAVTIPTQWDIERVGVPYRRMTVRRADFAPDFVSADSFAVTAEQRATYRASTAPRPMHESVPVPEPRSHEGGVVELGGFGLAAGAVRLGEGWLVLGAGQASFNYDQAVAALAGAGVARIDAVVIGTGTTGNGGVARAAERGLPIYTAPLAEPFVRTMLANAGLGAETIVVVSEARALGTGSDAAVLAPVDLSDSPGSLMLFRPATGWLWVPEARTPLDVRLAREQAEALGWDVRSVGDARALTGG